MWRTSAGWREGVAGAGLLTLLLYDYQAAFVLPALPLTGLLLATTWRARAWCAALLVGAGLLYLPQVASNVVLHDIWGALRAPWRPFMGRASNVSMLHPGFQVAPWTTLVDRTLLALRCFATPVAHLGNMTAPTTAVHPEWVLVLAGLGWLRYRWRPQVLLLLLLGAGLLPGVVSNTFGVSAHRMIFALPVVSLCAARAVDWWADRTVRVAAAVLFATGVTYWSVTYFFAPSCGSAIDMPRCGPMAPPSFWWPWP
jgi:hypothetical protein